MTSLSVLGPASVCGSDYKKWIEFVSGDFVKTDLNTWYWYTGSLSILGAWLSSFVILLDWETPWQVWPIPCCYGAVIGFLVGNLIYYLKKTVSQKAQFYKR